MRIKCNQRGEVNLLALLILSIFTVTGLAYAYKSYQTSAYQQEAAQFGNEVVLLAANITNSMAHENNCIKLNNRYVIDNGLLTSAFKKSNDTASDVIEFKYGTITISSNLAKINIPGDLTEYDGYYIRLNNYKWQSVPLFIDPLIDHFDRVLWQGEIVEKKDNLKKYYILLNAKASLEKKVTIELIKWGC